MSSSPAGTAVRQFSLYVAGDAYSTAQKIMGRQSAGASLLRGVFRCSTGGLTIACPTKAVSSEFSRQAISSGYTGVLQTDVLPDLVNTKKLGSLYYPAPPVRDLALLRNRLGSRTMSIFGVTHTIASKRALEQIGDMVAPPFTPWDALVCTSEVAKSLVEDVQEEMRFYWSEAVGATRFVQPELPVIPLGVNVNEFSSARMHRYQSRKDFGIFESDIVLLFVGRLAFFGKANPLGTYVVLDEIDRHFVQSTVDRHIVVVEVGIYPNEPVGSAYRAAQSQICPGVRFIYINGSDAKQVEQAWSLADIFVSLADNIQETFGITPVEAMACGLPVVVSDWNGYKDTVRHGIDGFRVSTTLPQAGAGEDLALRYGVDADTYDMYIGRVSLATVVDLNELKEALILLIENDELRRNMGQSGFARASREYDWEVILKKYNDLTFELHNKRKNQSVATSDASCPVRADPFSRFSHFPTSILTPSSKDLFFVVTNGAYRLGLFKGLAIANYGFKEGVADATLLDDVFKKVSSVDGGSTIEGVLAFFPPSQQAQVIRAWMWLWKFGLINRARP